MVTLPIWGLGSSSRSSRTWGWARELVRPVKPHPLGRREMRVGSQRPRSIIMCVHTLTSGQNPHQGTFTYKHHTNWCHTVSYTYTLISSYCLLIHTLKRAPNIDIQPLVCTYHNWSILLHTKLQAWIYAGVCADTALMYIWTHALMHTHTHTKLNHTRNS